MSPGWEVIEDGYNKRDRLIDPITKRVLGEVSGSEYTREWYAFIENETGAVRIGKFTTRLAAQDAVMVRLRGVTK